MGEQKRWSDAEMRVFAASQFANPFADVAKQKLGSMVIQLANDMEAEKARTQKLVEECMSKLREICNSWNEFGPEVMDETIYRTEQWLKGREASANTKRTQGW